MELKGNTNGATKGPNNQSNSQRADNKHSTKQPKGNKQSTRQPKGIKQSTRQPKSNQSSQVPRNQCYCKSETEGAVRKNKKANNLLSHTEQCALLMEDTLCLVTTINYVKQTMQTSQPSGEVMDEVDYWSTQIHPVRDEAKNNCYQGNWTTKCKLSTRWFTSLINNYETRSNWGEWGS